MKFKHEKDKTRFFFLHPLVILIAADMSYYCKTRNIPFVITSSVSTLKEDQALKRKSSTHRTARSIDVRSRVFNEQEKKEFINYFENKYSHIAATDKNGKPNLIVYHNHHFHVQIHSRYAINNPLQ